MSDLLLLSGGIDSTCLAFWRQPSVALTVDYGQLAAEAEIDASRQICLELGIQHDVLQIDCRTLGAGCMSGLGRNLPHNTSSEWWPFRNQILITFAAAYGLLHGIETLVVGTVASDRRHGDGTEEFLRRMAGVLSCQEGSLELLAPAVGLSSVELAQRAGIPMRLLAWAHSCHTSTVACGDCPGCNKNRYVWSTLKETNEPELVCGEYRL